VCQKPFALSDIVRFIQHKVASCNKENFGQCFAAADRERDNEDGALPLSTINTRRPSISAPISGKKGSGSRVHTPPPASPRLPAPGDLCVDGAASSTPKRRASASPLTSSSLEDGEDIKPDIKQERMDTTEESSQCKKSRTEFADAESNTTHSGEYEKWVAHPPIVGVTHLEQTRPFNGTSAQTGSAPGVPRPAELQSRITTSLN
jgi:hypothetical protein